MAPTQGAVVLVWGCCFSHTLFQQWNQTWRNYILIKRNGGRQLALWF